MDIVVLAGGLSTERDVSFVTGEKVSDALKQKEHRVILLDVFMGYRDAPCDVTGIFEKATEISVQVGEISTNKPDLAKVKAMRKDQSDCFFGPNVIDICTQADIVFMALHGENGENGKIQAVFDLFGIKYTGTGYLSSALAMDKSYTKQLFQLHHIPTPKGMWLYRKDEKVIPHDRGFSYPVVVKPMCGGSSIGVSIARNEQEYNAAVKEAFEMEDGIIVEEYVKGREFAISVLEGKALPIIEIAPLEGFYDYKNKYKAGSAVETCPAELSEAVTLRMQEIAVKAADVLGLDTYSRLDFLLNEQEEIFCLEANTLPGMTPTSLLPQEAVAIGIEFPELCERLIEISMKKYEEGLSV